MRMKRIKSIASVFVAACMVLSTMVLSPIKANAEGNKELWIEMKDLFDSGDNMKGSVSYSVVRDEKTIVSETDIELSKWTKDQANKGHYKINSLQEGDTVTVTFTAGEGYYFNFCGDFGGNADVNNNVVTVTIGGDNHIECEFIANTPGGGGGGGTNHNFYLKVGETEFTDEEGNIKVFEPDECDYVDNGMIFVSKADNGWGEVYLKNFSIVDTDVFGWHNFTFGGDATVIIEGENNIGAFALLDGARVEISGFNNWGGEPQPLNVRDGFFYEGEEEGRANNVRIDGDIKLTVGFSEQPTTYAFNRINSVDIRNYDFHERDNINCTFYADSLLCDVPQASIRSSKIEIYQSNVQGMTPTSDLDVFAGNATPGTLDIYEEAEIYVELIAGAKFGHANSMVNHFYAWYPENGLAENDDVSECLFQPGLATYTILDEDLEDGIAKEDDSGLILTHDGNKYTIKNIDPILYSVSYHSEEGPVNGDKGTVMLTGYEKGFFIKYPDRNTGRDTFEAWIAAGETVNVEILPDAGYQYQKDTLNINGVSIENNTPGEERGTYSFVMSANPGHMSAGFAKTEDAVENSSEAVKSASVSNTAGAVSNGNVKLEVSDTTVSDADKAKIQEAAGKATIDSILDIDLSEMVVKNYDPQKAKQDSWDTEIHELTKPVSISVALSETLKDGESVQIIREHEGKAEVINSTYDAKSGTVSFATDKFSTYAIAKTEKPVEKKIASVTVKTPSVAYTGKALTPKLVVKDPAGNTISSKYYKLKWSNNKAIGKATVTVTGKSGYTGSKKATFSIVPGKVKSFSSAKSTSKKKLTLKWKSSKGATGFEVQVSTDKNFKKSVKKSTIKNVNTVTKTFTGLKSGKKYYARVRGYKKVSGKTYYSDWTVSKAVKVK